MGQGKPRNTIWTSLMVLVYQMLFTKFQGNRSIVLEKKFYKMFLQYMGIAAMLFMWPNSFLSIFIHILP